MNFRIRFNENNRKWLGFTCVLLGALLFSGKGIIIKLAYTEKADAITVLTFRMLMAAPFYLLFAFKRAAQPTQLKVKHHLLLVFLGIIGYYFSAYADFTGLQYISASLERIILFIYPTFVTLLSYFIFRKNITKIGILALVITYSGVIMAMGYEAITENTNAIRGVVWVWLSAFTYAIYMVYSDHLVHLYGTMVYTARIMLVSSICVFLHFIFTCEIIALTQYSNRFYLICGILAVFGTVLPSFLATAGIKWIGAKNTAVISTLGPIWTIFLAYVILGENIHVWQLAGGTLVITGVMINQIFSK